MLSYTKNVSLYKGVLLHKSTTGQIEIDRFEFKHEIEFWGLMILNGFMMHINQGRAFRLKE